MDHYSSSSRIGMLLRYNMQREWIEEYLKREYEDVDDFYDYLSMQQGTGSTI